MDKSNPIFLQEGRGSPISRNYSRSVDPMENVNSAICSKRNYLSSQIGKDGLIEWIREMLYHSFVLNAKESYHGTMIFFEELIEEHRIMGNRSRLQQFVPTVSTIHTSLPMLRAFQLYDSKYCISEREFVPPSFNELRHILNLAQIMAVGKSLKMISFGR